MMKRALGILLFILLVALPSPSIVAQGLVNFINNPTTLVSYEPAGGGPPQVIPAVREQYYFGLFIAPPGTTDPLSFTFTGVYATNQSTAGRPGGPMVIRVPFSFVAGLRILGMIGIRRGSKGLSPARVRARFSASL